MRSLRFRTLFEGVKKKNFRLLQNVFSYSTLPNIYVEEFCENTQLVKAINYFREKALIICLP